MFGGPLSFLVNIKTHFSVGLGISVFKRARVLKDGKILRVSGFVRYCRKLDLVIEWTMYSVRCVWMAAVFCTCAC